MLKQELKKERENALQGLDTFGLGLKSPSLESEIPDGHS